MTRPRKGPSDASPRAATSPGPRPVGPGAPEAGASEALAFPVVGVGASAGGLEALRQLFGRLPADAGIGFVVVQHLEPERPSMLTSVLEGVTGLRVVEAESGMPVAPDRVHVIPSGSDLAIERGILRLSPRRRTGRLHLPIDSFFRSLSEDRRHRAIGVVLSGSGADGAEGLRVIKAEGGIAMVQEPDSAQFRGMPESAIAAGVIDFRGTPVELADELVRLGRHPYVAVPPGAEGEPQGPVPDQEPILATVFALVRQQSGIDLRGYKRTTVLRRIERRMALRRVDVLEAYAALLRDDPREVRALAQDMLIHVTSFFRDPDAFAALKEKVFVGLEQAKEDGDSIRVWVPGCSTGEEVYALAIGLLEAFGARAEQVTLKLFGTDLSEEAVETARVGRYPEAAVAGVAPDRLARFFEHTEGGYQVAKRVRDRCVFVKHDLTRDPPFAKLDLISCRNVLIYFDTELQRQVVPLFHHCLNKNGHLFVGKSEAIADFMDIFLPVDREQRIFVKTGESRRLVYPLPAPREAEGRLSEGRLAVRRQPAREAQRQADHLLLARFAPPGVLVNDRLEVVQFRGRTGAYLEQPPGQPQTNLLRMVRDDLAAYVHEAIEAAKARSAPVRRTGLRVLVGAERRVVDLEIVPLAYGLETAERYYLVLFDEPQLRLGEPTSRAPVAAELETPLEAGAEVQRLRVELAATKEYLQSLISEHQAATDDLAATNEEMVATNEELQSTNEELQSAKEELQATNEELSTVNDQLRVRHEELDRIANDLENVLSSVEIPVIIVDIALRVRRFTPAVSDIASFIPEDVGRPIDDLRLDVLVDDLPARIRQVLDGKSPMEWAIQRRDGRWFRMHVRPYRTADDRLDGAVLAFVDVDALTQARRDAEAARDYARNIVETVTTALLVLDSSLRVLSANASFLERWSPPAGEVVGRYVFDLGGGPWDEPSVRATLEESLAKRAPFTAFEVTTQRPDGGSEVLSLTGRPIVSAGVTSMMLLAIDDVTGLRSLEAERTRLLAHEKQARLDAERANQAKDVFLATLSHELRTPLSTMLMSAQLLARYSGGDSRIERASAAIERATQTQSRLIDDLLDVSRIVSGKLLLELVPVDLDAVARTAIELAQPSARAKSLTLALEADGELGTLHGDTTRLLQVIDNLLTNAIKFTPPGGRVTIRLSRDGERAVLTVTDTGMGIRAEVLPRLFDRFVQADSSVTRTHGGLGLGLSIVRHVVEAHGGGVEAESPGEGRGATFRVFLPLAGAPVAASATAPGPLSRGIGGVRVLLVEDDEDGRETCAEVLRALGADVRAARSAMEGLRSLEEFRPQVILSDVAMPGEDGFSFIRRVRSLSAERGGLVPAAAITALGRDEDRQRALQAGFQLHVRKPVDAALLESIVVALVDDGRSEEPPAASPRE